ncbi:MAG TPA: hypothetical protein VHD31_01035 [Candidatus Paceibacterota bacterium]|nr:hypothetical protein [Candidatus Paceibacterota bacterium]
MLKKLKTHVHNRVLVQLVLFAIVSLGLLGAVLYDVIEGEIGLMLLVVALLVGFVVGYVVGKIFKLSWHEDTRKVIMSLDKMSFVLIGIYVVFRIFGEQLLGQYIHGDELSAFTFTFLDGLLIGRLVSVWRGVTRILREQGIM